VVDETTGLLAVGVRNPDGVVLIRLATMRVVGRVALGGAPRHLELAGPGGPLLVPAEGTDRLYQLSLPDGAVVTTTPVGRQPHDAAAAAGGRIFVGNELADTVAVIAGDRVVQVLTAPTQPGGLAASPDGATVVVVGVRARRLTVYRADGTTIGTATAGVGPTHVRAGRADLYYVADTQGDAILTYTVEDGTIRQIARSTARGAPYGLAVDPARGVLYVTLTATNQLEAFRIDGQHLRAERRWLTPRQANSVAVDTATGRVFVAGAADGLLQVIQP
jgi:DNA-binding beta-propeller fold protein YncE